MDDYYTLLTAAPLRLLSAVVDKLHMQERYGTSAWYAPTAAFEVLMQRAVQAVGEGDQLAVTVDNISGKTPKNREYQALLSAHHERLTSRGSHLQPNLSFAPLSRKLRFKDSKASDLIQSADLVAYNVHRQFRDHGADWEVATPTRLLETYEYFKRIAPKFYQGRDGRIQGYGVVKFPLIQRVPWRLMPPKAER